MARGTFAGANLRRLCGCTVFSRDVVDMGFLLLSEPLETFAVDSVFVTTAMIAPELTLNRFKFGKDTLDLSMPCWNLASCSGLRAEVYVHGGRRGGSLPSDCWLVVATAVSTRATFCWLPVCCFDCQVVCWTPWLTPWPHVFHVTAFFGLPATADSYRNWWKWMSILTRVQLILSRVSTCKSVIGTSRVTCRNSDSPDVDRQDHRLMPVWLFTPCHRPI